MADHNEKPELSPAPSVLDAVRALVAGGERIGHARFRTKSQDTSPQQSPPAPKEHAVSVNPTPKTSPKNTESSSKIPAYDQTETTEEFLDQVVTSLENGSYLAPVLDSVPSSSGVASVGAEGGKADPGEELEEIDNSVPLIDETSIENKVSEKGLDLAPYVLKVLHSAQQSANDFLQKVYTEGARRATILSRRAKHDAQVIIDQASAEADFIVAKARVRAAVEVSGRLRSVIDVTDELQTQVASIIQQSDDPEKVRLALETYVGRVNELASEVAEQRSEIAAPVGDVVLEVNQPESSQPEQSSEEGQPVRETEAKASQKGSASGKKKSGSSKKKSVPSKKEI